MPGATFDAFLRHAARASTRRGVVGSSLSALTSSVLAMLGRPAVDHAAAKKKRKKKKKCAKDGQRPKKKKRCCKGLSKDATGRCATPCDVCQPAGACRYDTVQAAVDDATPGAALTLCAGVFSETIAIAKNLTLVGTGDGAGAGNTILDGANAGTVVEIEAGSTVTLQNLRITGGNTGGEGGGIVNFGTLMLTDCTVIGNTSFFSGGGIRNAGTLTLTDCAVIGNTTDGGDGGGIANFGTLELINSTVSGNTAIDSGGGIINGGTVELIDSSVTANEAGSAAGGINNFGTIICSGSSTVSGNTRDDPPVPSNCIDAISGAAGCATCPD